MTDLREFINEIAPTHQRTSCNEENWYRTANYYMNESGYPRCVRCALLYRLHFGVFPYDAVPEVVTLVFRVDVPKTNEMIQEIEKGIHP